jgi:hypothetical protein
MNTVQRAILRACWQKESEDGMHAARPWFRRLLSHVFGMKAIPPRESETKRRRREQWLAVRREAALQIDAETAEVFWEHGQVLDPYGLYDLTDEEFCIGRNYFARSPGSNVWVWFGDLPDVVSDRLWERLRAGDLNYDDLDWLVGESDTGRGGVAS